MTNERPRYCSGRIPNGEGGWTLCPHDALPGTWGCQTHIDRAKEKRELAKHDTPPERRAHAKYDAR